MEMPPPDSELTHTRARRYLPATHNIPREDSSDRESLIWQEWHINYFCMDIEHDNARPRTFSMELCEQLLVEVYMHDLDVETIPPLL